MMEEYRAVKGFEGFYEVSNLGNVKSLARESIIGRQLKEKILKPYLRCGRYLVLNLFKDGISESRYVHQLVAIAFLGHEPNGHKIVVDHRNNLKTDNRLENLQIITARQNSSKDRKGSSKYTGVYWNKGANKWKAQIVINGKDKYLGYFTNEIEAHEAYQTRLKEII